MQTTYPVPVYTGIVVVNPPGHPDYSRPNPNNPKPPAQPPTGSNQPSPRVVKQPDEVRPNSGPRMAPVEHPKIAAPREVKSESAPKAEPPKPSPTPPASRVETPRPAPPSPAPTPKVEAAKVETKTDTKTDSSVKKQ